jgi:hypothetical protein
MHAVTTIARWKDNPMRAAQPILVAGAILLAAALPCLFRPPQAPTPPGTRQSPAMQTAAEMRACMAPDLSGVTPQVLAHMQEWRAANPAATHEAEDAERRGFAQPLLLAAWEPCEAAIRPMLAK